METPDLINVPDKVLTDYAKVTEQNYKTQVASERTYYDGFKRMLEEIFPPRKGYLIQIEPKTADNKNKPDIVVSYNGIVLFYIEAKLPKTPITSLIQNNNNNNNNHAKSRALQDQMHRYYASGTQLLITDFMKVWLYDENMGDDIQNSSYNSSHLNFECILLEEKNNRFQVAADAKTNFHRLLSITCEDYLQTISNVKNLITPLARIAILLRNKARYLLNGHKSENKPNYSPAEKIASLYLLQIRDDFKKSIFKEEIENENDLFADLFAQTIVYGAFSAWIKYCQKRKDGKEFSITTVGDYLPFGSFLRQLFLDLRNRVPIEFKQLLDEMEGRFRKTEYKKVMQNTETLITTFYSDFLHEYDPITAKERGVVYTPFEIVKFIIQSIDFMLKRWLDKPEGIISTSILKQDKNSQEALPKTIDRLRILDPAAGTMAFASGLLHLAREKMDEKYTAASIAQSAFNDWVKNEFFRNMFAFEILMAPYVLGHIRTFLTLDELGLRISQEEFRLNSYLMNTLMTPPHQSNMDEWIFNNQDIGREIKEAIKIRDHRDIFVIMGNPPYNLSSQNNCAWINEKLGEYKAGLDEKNQKILADDYVKFLRFGQWKIEQVGTGILAFITNNKYFDGQMFSVMRKSLRKTFDHIYIVNLHGDMRKNESGNPFDIRVGVGIAIMVRMDDSPNKNAAIHYMDVPHATREEKFAVLGQGFDETRFRLLPETQKNYFVEMNTDLLEHYESFIPINRLFKAEPTSGIMVGRDRLLMDVDPAVVEENLRWFYNKNFEKLEQYKINVSDTKSWAREKVYSKTTFEKSIKNLQEIQYRGFDYRHLAYDRDVVEGHRMGYIDQISPNNPAITVTKASRKAEFCTAFISSKPIEKCYMSVTDTAYAFPFTLNGVINIQPLSLPFRIDPESLFYYAYAILWAPTYRQRYDEFLRKSYPGIPFPKNKQHFDDLSFLGRKIAAAHLLEIFLSPKLEPADIPADDWIIRDFTFSSKEERIYFDCPKKDSKLTKSNKIIPSIGGITQKMWDFSIGGIQQLQQFLKSRQYSTTRKWNTLSRGLNHQELVYFLKICSAIQNTIEILPQIDEIYEKIDHLD